MLRPPALVALSAGVACFACDSSTLGLHVQRSLHVPNLTHNEVTEMFRQYQEESGQRVEPQVVDTLHDLTRGQPGLIGWFAELLTEKYNPRPRPVDMGAWHRVYAAACQIEPNNTMLNLLKKAKGPYLPQVLLGRYVAYLGRLDGSLALVSVFTMSFVSVLALLRTYEWERSGQVRRT